MDKGAWRATGHGVAKSQTRLKRLSTRMWPPVAGLQCQPHCHSQVPRNYALLILKGFGVL